MLVKDINLPTRWLMSEEDEAVHFCRMKMSEMTQPMVESTDSNISMSWHTHALRKLLTLTSCKLLSTFPEKIFLM